MNTLLNFTQRSVSSSFGTTECLCMELKFSNYNFPLCFTGVVKFASRISKRRFWSLQQPLGKAQTFLYRKTFQWSAFVMTRKRNVREKEDKEFFFFFSVMELEGRSLKHRGFDYMAFPIEHPQAEGIVYFFHIDFNLFIPSFFSAELKWGGGCACGVTDQ